MKMKRDYSKFKNFEKSRREFNNWQGAAWIYFDLSDGEVMTRVFQPVSWHSDSIVTVYFKDDLYGRDDTISKEKLYDLLESVVIRHKQGWSKEDFRHEFLFRSAEAFIENTLGVKYPSGNN